jgi:hypothetical protein
MSEALKIVTADDAALLKQSIAHAEEQNLRSEDDSGRLIDLLKDIDSLKHEIHERMRRIEAVKQAREILLEDAARTEALNRKLTELGRAMAGGNSEMAPHGSEFEDSGEGTALPWRRSSESKADHGRWHDAQNPVTATEVQQPYARLDGHLAQSDDGSAVEGRVWLRYATKQGRPFYPLRGWWQRCSRFDRSRAKFTRLFRGV